MLGLQPTHLILILGGALLLFVNGDGETRACLNECDVVI